MTESTRPGRGYVLGGRYLLEEKLGRGGMSTVWRAHDEVLGREVAVKIISEMEDAQVTAERFRREARATAALNHPNIVTVFDAGVDDDRAYLVMELLPGETLAEELRSRGALPHDEVRSIALQVTAALGAAHDAGLVHRDVKPGNIARSSDGGVKVLDFGITHIIDEAVVESTAPLTATGTVIGTAAYLAPEQARGERVDRRADLYSLGCVLFALLTGKPPFQKPTAVSTLVAHATDPIPDLRELRPDVPPDLIAVVNALLAKDPQARPADAAAVAAALSVGTEQAATQFMAPPAFDEATTVVAASDLPTPMRAHPSEVPNAVAPHAHGIENAEDTGGIPLPFEEEEDDGRRGPLVGLVVVALLLAGGVTWWLLTRDTELTVTPAPTSAVAVSSSATIEAPLPIDDVTPSVVNSPTAAVTPTPITSTTANAPTGNVTTAAPATTATAEVVVVTQAPATTAAVPASSVPAPPVSQPPASAAPPVVEAPKPPPAVQQPPTQAEAPPVQTSAPVQEPNPGEAAQAAQNAADALGSAVQDAFTGGSLSNEDRRAITAGLRDLSAALRSGDPNQAGSALATVDQALSNSGQRSQFEGLFSQLSSRVTAWRGLL